jgi:DNA primase
MRAKKSDTPQLDLGPVLIHYGAKDLPSRYGWHTMKCPFPEHNDSRASARVNLSIGGFVCLACGIRGDAIKIIRDREGLSFGKALEFAREVFGASITPVYDADAKPVATKRIGRHRWKDVLD